MPPTNFKFVTSDMISRYESGDMTEDEVIELFQALVDTGMVWSLQGSYARMAATLIEAGLVKQ